LKRTIVAAGPGGDFRRATDASGGMKANEKSEARSQDFVGRRGKKTISGKGGGNCFKKGQKGSNKGVKVKDITCS